MNSPSTRRILSTLLVLIVAACVSGPSGAEDPGAGKGVPAIGELAELSNTPRQNASSPFWQHWGDGQAELTSYTGVIARYGEPREATAVLIYVTEAMDRRTWVKDEATQAPDRVSVLKLNRTTKFSTGLYPYSVMTSVFSPVDDFGHERFQPVKVDLSVQEWCGHVFHAIWPGPARLLSRITSYFASEGDAEDVLEVAPKALYQDALPIQLRELDAPFAGGANWSGTLVPTLWHHRVAHKPLQPVEATIVRDNDSLDGLAATRFVLRYGEHTETYYIEKEAPRRLLGWEHSDGTRFRLLRTTRLPYWQLNKPGDESHLEALGLTP
ncbi:MAG: hypothetical protein H0U74_04065 [Bradymonadaceae bacterium]|nr:hypothetical protein [Lujinxingiaceae bacterium]